MTKVQSTTVYDMSQRDVPAKVQVSIYIGITSCITILEHVSAQLWALEADVTKVSEANNCEAKGSRMIITCVFSRT